MLLAACHKVLVFTTAARSTNKESNSICSANHIPLPSIFSAFIQSTYWAPGEAGPFPALFTLIAEIIRVSPLLHCRRGMIEPRQIANHSLVISVVAPWDFHGCDLSQPDFEMSTKGIFMQRLGTCLHVALQSKMAFFFYFGRVSGDIPGPYSRRPGCHFYTFYHHS